MSLLNRNRDIFDIFSDFDDRLSQRMKRFERLADKMFQFHDIDPFYELFDEEEEIQEEDNRKNQNNRQDNNQRSELYKSQKQKELKQKKQEKKRQNQERIQQIKREKESIFDLFSHYDKLFNERMRRFEALTEKMFDKLGNDYFGNEIVSERNKLNRQQQSQQQQPSQPSQAQNKQQEESQQKLNENKMEIEKQSNNQSEKQVSNKQSNEQISENYKSPFDIFEVFDKLFKERMERFESLTDRMFQKFEPQFIEQKKQENSSSNQIKSEQAAQSCNDEKKNDKESKKLNKRRRSFDMFFRPFKFIDDNTNSEEEYKQKTFSKEHQKLTKENNVQNQPSTYYSSSYSCIQKVDKEGKQTKEERHSSEYTERDQKGSVITKSRHLVNDNGNEMEIEERILDGKGVRKIVSKGIDGKCEEKTLLHNMKNEDVQKFEENWKIKEKENNFIEKTQKSLSNLEKCQEKQAINEH